MDASGSRCHLPLIAIFNVHGEEDKGNGDANNGKNRDHKEEGHANVRRNGPPDDLVNGRFGTCAHKKRKKRKTNQSLIQLNSKESSVVVSCCCCCCIINMQSMLPPPAAAAAAAAVS